MKTLLQIPGINNMIYSKIRKSLIDSLVEISGGKSLAEQLWERILKPFFYKK